MAQTLKIMSWNVEKLSEVSLFESYNRGRGFKRGESPEKVIEYLKCIIKETNPQVVCLIEGDARTAVEVCSTLGSRLGTDWSYIISPGVHGGSRDEDGQISNNEVYIVFYKNSILEIDSSRPNGQIIAPKLFSIGRNPFAVRFTFKGTTSKFEVWVVHLSTTISGTSELELLKTEYLNNPMYNGYKDFIFCGDFNVKFQKINAAFSTQHNFQDVYQSMNIPFNSNKDKYLNSSKLKYAEQTKNPVRGPMDESEEYRDLDGGIDDIISFNNSNTAIKSNTQPQFSQETGIVDTIKAYSETPIKSSSYVLQALNTNEMERMEKIKGVRTAYSYAQKLIYPTNSKNDNILYNGWLRYQGGISDHLPIVMTIDIP